MTSERAAALEEAAKVAAAIARKAANEVHNFDSYGGPSLPGRGREVVRMETADEIEAAIRALIPTTQPEPGEQGVSDIVKLLGLFAEAYDRKGMIWIGTVTPKRAFTEAADEITALRAEVARLATELRTAKALAADHFRNAQRLAARAALKDTE